MDFYDFVCRKNDGSDFSFSLLKGKIVLIFNSAIYDSFSNQYLFLNKLYQEHKGDEFEILDFPCNQFHGMAPGNDAEIEKEVQEKYHPRFLRFCKCDVKGETVHPLFAYLVKKKGFRGLDESHPMTKIIQSEFIRNGHSPLEKNPEIRWNFTKFLVDRYGKVVRRFEATEDMFKIGNAIWKLVDCQPKLVGSGTDGVFFEEA